MPLGVEITLYEGTALQSSLTDLICLWWDSVDVCDFDTPIGRTNQAFTDSSGVLTLDISNVSGLTAGQWGYLLVRKEDSTNHKDSLVFQGRVQASSITNGTLVTYPTSDRVWTRNPDWQTYTEPSTEKFVGLHAVYEAGSNFLALSAEENYTVDWGDGTSTENFNSGVVAYHNYDYTAFDSGKDTQGYVTFTDSTDTVNRNNHGRSNGDLVSFEAITTTTGITAGEVYYVVNATTNSYQLATSEGGTALTLTNDGSGYTLPYKTVVVQVYPQGGANLTKLNLHQKHDQSNLQLYSSGFLDISLYAPNCTDLRIGVANPGSSTQNISFSKLEQVNIISSDLRQLEYLFCNCYLLGNIKGLVTSSAPVASMSCTFTDSGDLVTATAHGFRNGDSVFFTAITSTTGITVDTRYFVINKTADTFQVATSYTGAAAVLTTDGTGTVLRGTVPYYIFYQCFSLRYIPLIDTSNFSSVASIFNSLSNIRTIPLLNTSNSRYFDSMFSNCGTLKSIPLIDTSNGRSFINTFQACSAISYIPQIDTSNGLTLAGCFIGCNSLKNIPLLDTSNCTNFNLMFNACKTLKTIPLLDTSSGTNFSSMFSMSAALQTIPLIDTSSGTNFASIFQNCNSLEVVPLFNTSSSTNGFSNLFTNCYSLQKGALQGTNQTISYSACKLSPTAINEIFSYLASNVTAQTITVTSNWGAAKVSLSGTTTSGSTTVTMASTAGLSANMWITGTNISSSRSVTFQDTGDTITLNNHGIPNGTRVSFTAITSTTGLTLKTIYYVVNTQTNTFQVSDTVGGSAKALTTNGSGTLIYENYIVSIVPNTSITISIPASGSATNTLTSTTINPYLATLKGWTVTN